jgi:hypothetical protein
MYDVLPDRGEPSFVRGIWNPPCIPENGGTAQFDRISIKLADRNMIGISIKSVIKGCRLPNVEVYYFEELDRFLKGNEAWYARGAMVGCFDDDGRTRVGNCKGSQNFIDYRQSPQNAFSFGVLEALSLFFAKRLVIVAKDRGGGIRALSGHELVSRIAEFGIVAFKRAALTARTTAVERKEEKA